jgi:hypothetical protein
MVRIRQSLQFFHRERLGDRHIRIVVLFEELADQYPELAVTLCE